MDEWLDGRMNVSLKSCRVVICLLAAFLLSEIPMKWKIGFLAEPLENQFMENKNTDWPLAGRMKPIEKVHENWRRKGEIFKYVHMYVYKTKNWKGKSKINKYKYKAKVGSLKSVEKQTRSILKRNVINQSQKTDDSNNTKCKIPFIHYFMVFFIFFFFI